MIAKVLARSFWYAAPLAVLFAIAFGCGSSSSARATPEQAFCSAMAKSYECAGSSQASCAKSITPDCSKLASLVNPSVLDGATKCIQAAGCGSDPLGCLASSLDGVRPSAVQSTFATEFCSSCSVVTGDSCIAAFYGNATTPGLGYLLLPFGDTLVEDVGSACTKNKLGRAACQAAFSSCLSVQASQTLAGAISVDSATCLLDGLKTGLTVVDGGKREGGAACTGCAGCCANGKCVAGDTPSACGAGGGACQSCGSGSSCTNGICVPPCGPDTCAGCCAAGVCQDGNAPTACGSRGATCIACPGGDACTNHQCIDPSCKASCTSGCCNAAGCEPGSTANACGTGGNACTDCGSGRACSSGKCGFDGASLWDLVVIAARLPATTLQNDAWDALGGLPDPYAKAISGVNSGTTISVADTLTPQWNATLLDGIAASNLIAELKFELWDSDVTFDDFVGGCTLTLTNAEFDANLHTVSCPQTDTGVALQVDYRLKPH